MPGQRMTGGDAIVQALLAEGVDTVFGIPGAQTYGLFDALHRAGDSLRLLAPRHEQTAGYMAFGYAKATGRVGVYTVVPGPGMLNSSAALCSAYGASTPVVCVTSEVPSAFLGRGMGHLHELPDQLATMRTLTKWAALIERPADAPRLVAEAFREAASGRPRPTALEMPWDVIDAFEDVPAPVPSRPEPPPRPDADAIDRAAALLRDAANPMIMVGSGALGAAAEILELAERLQAPVVSFRSGRGIVSDDHYLGFTCASGFERWAETDVLIGIGSRLELQWFRWPDQAPGMKLVNVDIDPEQMTRLQPDVPVLADARAAVEALLAALPDAPRASRRDEFEQLKQHVDAQVQEITPHAQHLAAIRRALPREGFFVEELCQAGFTSYYAFPVYEPRAFVTCGHQGTLGFGFPTALGVQAAFPDRPVVSITGDGGFMFGLADLATAVQNDLPVVTVVFDNGRYGNVVRDQERLYDGRVIGGMLQNPDFVALAESFGALGLRVETSEQLERAIGEALASEGPAVISVAVDPRAEATPWRFLMPASRVTG